jgi:hypothetical protein
MDRIFSETLNWYGILFSVVIAVGITVIYWFVLKNKGPWARFMPFFFVIFLGIWAASFWLHPFGPAIEGVAWVPMLFIGILVSLLLSAALPSKKRKKATENHTKAPDQSKGALYAFLWLLVVILIIPILIAVFS